MEKEKMEVKQVVTIPRADAERAFKLASKPAPRNRCPKCGKRVPERDECGDCQ